MPGHEGIPSIEEADRFTKKYAEADFVGPELFFGVPRSMMYLHNIIEAWEQGEKTTYKPRRSIEPNTLL